eukprot:jgi/Mesvir1/9713/Mv25322-RA.1
MASLMQVRVPVCAVKAPKCGLASKSSFSGRSLKVTPPLSKSSRLSSVVITNAAFEPDAQDVKKAMAHLGLQVNEAAPTASNTDLSSWRVQMTNEIARAGGGRFSPGQIADAVRMVELEKFGGLYTMPSADFSARDINAACSFYVLLWKRKTLPQQLFDDFWRNVHGPVCARLPGQHQYWQYHVDHSQGGIFQVAPGVEVLTDAEDQFDGIAELTFRSARDRRTWFDASAILMDDEHNCFSKAIGYTTLEGNCKTFKDLRRDPAPNGDTAYPCFHVLIRKNDLVSVDAFRNYIKDFCGLAYKSPNTSKVRMHLFEDIDLNRPDAQGVAHGEDPERVYHAAVELVFENRLNAELFFVSETYKEIMAQQAKFIKAVLPMPEKSNYAFVYNDQMTLAGIRGSQIAQNIVDCGAVNQLQDDVMQLMIKGWVGN